MINNFLLATCKQLIHVSIKQKLIIFFKEYNLFIHLFYYFIGSNHTLGNCYFLLRQNLLFIKNKRGGYNLVSIWIDFFKEDSFNYNLIKIEKKAWNLLKHEYSDKV